MLIRAQLLLPIAQPPIEDGALHIQEGRILEVGPFTELRRSASGPVIDLGNQILCAGLVNAHCHLDYTDMAGQALATREFSGWIKTITALKGVWTEADYAKSWRHGAAMLLENGVTAVGDIEAIFPLLPDAWNSTPLRVTSFLEMTGVKGLRDPQQIVDEATQVANQLTGHPRSMAALSPHAPYSTVPQLLQACSIAAGRHRLRLTMHVAESLSEFEMFMYRRGPMYDWLRSNDRPMDDTGLGSPVRHLQRHGLLHSNLLAVHVNYLWDGDAQLLADHEVTVAHCPNSHAYFSHKRFPYSELRKVGVRICLGTDSLASTPTSKHAPSSLSLLAEMRLFAQKHPGVPLEDVLKMGTLEGAHGLGRAGQVGELSVGAAADFFTIPCSDALSKQEAVEALFAWEGPVHHVMIAGEWVRMNPTNTAS